MTRVSSGAKKSGPPAHANRFAYTHNRNSKLTNKILAMPVSGLCPACRDVIEWRKRYRKYKPLTVVKKCVRCGEKRVKEAYHIICNPCAGQHRICAKCLQAYVETLSGEETAESAKTQAGDELCSLEKDGEDLSDEEDDEASSNIEDE